MPLFGLYALVSGIHFLRSSVPAKAKGVVVGHASVFSVGRGASIDVLKKN